MPTDTALATVQKVAPNTAMEDARFPELYWLPAVQDWSARIKAVETLTDPGEAWVRMVALANTRLDFVKTLRLDRALRGRYADGPPDGLATKPIRLAILASSTVSHLLPAIRVAGLRRGLWIKTYEPDYGQHKQELADPASGLWRFQPNTVLLAFDAYHWLRGADPGLLKSEADEWLDGAVADIRDTWRQIREAFHCPIVQQTVLPIFPALLGSNEHRLPGSPARLTVRLNEALREAADADGIDLLALDARAASDGLAFWHDPVLWHRAKQEVTPLAARLYGDLVGRILAARQGRSAKCMVLDLDNTLWGGVIGDDGLEGIVLGQGSAHGEAFVAFQAYALDQAKRGVILAVCSKNDEANALEPFERHPDMVLKRAHIGSFVANWQDKATNIRQIASELNIGLDSLVFVDDNPFERNLVREELPMVSVPEIPLDPGLVAKCLSDAGYFEGLAVTEEDRERTAQYQANRERSALQARATDLPSYLRGLDMKLLWRRFDAVGLPRIVQLINKTNQFNLTTRRYTDDDMQAVIADPKAFGLQLRLLDRYGDNGIIAIIIGRLADDGDAVLDTWLMSCRVLGRQVEEASLALAMDQAARLGARRLIGEYRPTAKNGMVREHYAKLGFSLESRDNDGASRWALDLASTPRPESFIQIVES